ncbi:hypothetical protein ACOXXX_17415 [Thalassococcus sp. BH17M4-6]|uniref:hypothetical protein n=1 Tax=Thalassococcus sp. BH17M4-6 TaxID=3413148 RepID=UPI003BE4D339
MINTTTRRAVLGALPAAACAAPSFLGADDSSADYLSADPKEAPTTGSLRLQRIFEQWLEERERVDSLPSTLSDDEIVAECEMLYILEDEIMAAQPRVAEDFVLQFLCFTEFGASSADHPALLRNALGLVGLDGDPRARW